MAKGRFPLLLILIAAIFILLFSSPSTHALPFHGFLEGAYGARFEEGNTQKGRYNLLEGRVQIKGSGRPKATEEWYGEFVFKGDLLLDGYDESTKGILREAALSLTPLDNMDIKMGRQVLTWGTGDLLFINDLFPKDYVSFMTGRDDEYLKLPSDAVRGSLFLERFNVDIILIPFFQANNSINGRRLSFYNGLMGKITGTEGSGDFYEPGHTWKNIEEAVRFYRTFGSMEGAFYLFNGFYKEPLGVSDPANMVLFYPELTVYGLSLRGPFAGGIGNFEMGYYDSREDHDGSDPMVENSGLKYLGGYEKDMGGDLKIGFQYQVEKMADYAGYRAGLPAGSPADDEFRHLITVRLTKLAINQNMDIGLFTFWSPSDKDCYLRPKVSYKFTDSLSTTVGGNIFMGEKDHTFFGQLRNNDNLYMRVRYSF